MSAPKIAIATDSARMPLRSGSRFPRQMLFPVLAGVLVSSSLLVLYEFNPAQFGFYPICLFHSTTGLLCPGCGSLRAMHQMLHGNLPTALHCNLLLVLSVPLVAGFGARFSYLRMRQKPFMPRIRPGWLYAATVVLLVFAVLRNLPGDQFFWLRP